MPPYAARTRPMRSQPGRRPTWWCRCYRSTPWGSSCRCSCWRPWWRADCWASTHMASRESRHISGTCGRICGDERARAEDRAMPIHDWTRVDAGIFHDFHHEWVSTISRALNTIPLPPGYYALIEQVARKPEPDFIRLEGPTSSAPVANSSGGGIALAAAPPRVWFRTRTEIDLYATKAKAVVIRHSSNHQVVAMVEIISPGNKNKRHGLRAFVEKAEEVLRAGIHL